VGSRVVDLSHPLDDRTHAYPGDPAVRSTPARSLERDGYRVSHLHLGSHSGTHVDAPSHVVDGGATVDQLPLHLLVGPAVLVDLRDLGPREPVGWERLAAYARPGRMLVLHTGWDRRWGSAAYEDHPYLDAEAAEALVAAGVRTVGIDALSIDETGSETFPAHEALLGAGGVVVENLRGLAAVDHPEPVLSVLPLPLRGCDGSPVRAVALLPS
jgi:kynurenine formamidase